MIEIYGDVAALNAPSVKRVDSLR